MGNSALLHNGFTNTVTVNNHITVRGSDWYFAVCAVMTATTFVLFGLAATKPRTQRLFHYITAAITLIASIAYFAMGSNLGWTGIAVEFPRHSNPRVAGDMRQIFYVRYIDWVLTTPLLLLDLLLTAGLPAPTICYTILMNEIMVITGLVGALVKSSYKWGFFTFGCVAFLFVAWTVVFEGRSHARSLGADIHRTYTICGVWTIALWFLYPIAWGLSEGGNVIASDSEAVFYGILDLLAKPGFGALLIWGHRNIDLSRMGLVVRDPAEDLAAGHHNGTDTETKRVPHQNGSNGVSATTTNGTTTTTTHDGATTHDDTTRV